MTTFFISLTLAFALSEQAAKPQVKQEPKAAQSITVDLNEDQSRLLAHIEDQIKQIQQQYDAAMNALNSQAAGMIQAFSLKTRLDGKQSRPIKKPDGKYRLEEVKQAEPQAQGNKK